VPTCFVCPGTKLIFTVQAGFPEITSSTLSEILINPHLGTETAKYNFCTLPFVNCKHRTRVRVVDFFPPEIKYFAHSKTDPGWGARAKKHDPGGGRSIEKWEWGFVLLVEDAHVPPNTVAQQLRVVVGNKEAEGLLKMNAAKSVLPSLSSGLADKKPVLGSTPKFLVGLRSGSSSSGAICSS
jgi:hypothetical protein